jgi:hypothetical protein
MLTIDLYSRKLTLIWLNGLELDIQALTYYKPKITKIIK